MKAVLAAALALGAVLTAGSMRASELRHSTPPELEAYLSSETYLDLVRRAMIRAESYQPSPCQDAVGTKRLDFVVLERITSDREAPVNGVWLDRIEAQRCDGSSAVYNILVTHSTTVGSSAEPLLMGTTEADPPLQRDAARRAIEQAALLPINSGCRTFTIENTSFAREVQRDTRSAEDDSWIEIWTVYGCERRTLIEMTFASDSMKTKVRARPIAQRE